MKSTGCITNTTWQLLFLFLFPFIQRHKNSLPLIHLEVFSAIKKGRYLPIFSLFDLPVVVITCPPCFLLSIPSMRNCYLSAFSFANSVLLSFLCYFYDPQNTIGQQFGAIWVKKNLTKHIQLFNYKIKKFWHSENKNNLIVKYAT